ncbi:histidine kinase [Streptomyces sp. NBC_01210]|uniref:sensor histidine kinase n=1 Tax=Streptomyces sp. NBC_01210 TaxID=2903774 RepID=UPI002E0D3041|nr:histidine kinase [Streptomyces sp. NBC_01210]
MNKAPARGSWRIVDRLAPAWLVVQFLGTAVLVVAMVTAREDTLWIWGVYAASLLCWTLFMVLHPVRPEAASSMLALSALLPALVVGFSDDSTAVIMLGVLLGRFTSMITSSARMLTVVTCACLVAIWISCALAGQPLTDVLGYTMLALVLTLFGLNRRQYEGRAKQAEQLLAQNQLIQQEQARAAALGERSRIAREMHDVLAHSLGALSVQLKVATALIEKGDAAGALTRVRRSNRLADEGLIEARNAVAALRGDVPSLPEALKSLAVQHRSNHPSEVHMDILGELRPISPAATVSLVQTAREALTNAAKHAPGETVGVTVEYRADALRLTVENATPTSSLPDPDHAPGYGLTGMRERLALVGGSLVANRLDGDTRWAVTAEVPE